MKHFVLAALLLVSSSAFAAGTITCAIQEIFDGQNVEQIMKVEATEDAHGSINFFQLQSITEVTGFIAFVKGYVVINLVHQASGVVSSSHGVADANNLVNHQIVLPSEGLDPKGVVVTCKAE